MTDARHLIMAGIAVVSLGLLLQIVGVATNNWIALSATGGSASFGLWKACVTIDGKGTVCSDLDYGATPDWMKVVRAFAILAVGFMSGAAVTAVVSLVKLGPAALGNVSFVFAIVGAVCSIVAVGEFAAKFDDLTNNYSSNKFDYSFDLCIVAAILSVIASVLLAIGRRQASQSQFAF